jgi:hypothetical protein
MGNEKWLQERQGRGEELVRASGRRLRRNGMRKKITRTVFALALLIGLLMALGVPAQAQGVSPTPTVPPVGSIPIPTSTQQVTLVSSDPNVVSFEQLSQTSIQLAGPYDSYRFSFALPADWKVTPGAQLILSVSSFLSSVVAGSSNPGVVGGGTLTVRLNNNILSIVPLNTIGDIEQKITVAPSDFVSINTDGSMTLDLVLDSGMTCQASNNMSLVIRPTSYFVIPHNSIQPDTSLAGFPRPIYQRSFVPDSALMVLPEHPTSAELQAAFTVAAGLGSSSVNALQLDMTTIGNFRPQDTNSGQATANHIIFVGKPSTLSILNQLHLPLRVTGGQFANTGGSADDGIVQMIDSPWSTSHVVLVVSGNTDQGIIKAAQAVSTNVLTPNSSPNLSIVKQVNPSTVSPSQSIDQTLGDLGMTGGLFASRGDFGNVFPFTIPAGRSLAADAYFELDYSNSALLNFDRSSIVVYVNNRPVGSVRMSDATAGQAMNQVRIAIPPAAVVPGVNQLQIRVSIVPLDNCTPPSSRGLWINIWPQSNLHLPLDVALISPVAAPSLAAYPAPFAYTPALADTAFVLSHDDLDSWRGAMKIAAALGAQTNGPVVEMSVFYSEELSADLRAKYNLLVIGEPTQLPLVNDINQFLPAPFASGSNIATENNFQVTYRIPADSPMGYVEIIPSPWNSNNVVLAALGNTVQGVNWAVSALTDPNLQARLAGNVAVVNASQIISTDTRIVNVTTGSSATGVPSVNLAPANQNTVTSLPSQSGWIVPVMIGALILIVVILIVTFVGSWSRNRVRKPHKDE